MHTHTRPHLHSTHHHVHTRYCMACLALCTRVRVRVCPIEPLCVCALNTRIRPVCVRWFIAKLWRYSGNSTVLGRGRGGGRLSATWRDGTAEVWHAFGVRDWQRGGQRGLCRLGMSNMSSINAEMRLWIANLTIETRAGGRGAHTRSPFDIILEFSTVDRAGGDRAVWWGD